MSPKVTTGAECNLADQKPSDHNGQTTSHFGQPKQHSQKNAMPPIIFILYPHMLASSVTLPLEMLQAAWAMAKTKNTQLAPLNIRFYSVSGGYIDTHSGLALASQPFAPLPAEDHLIFLPALWRNPLKIVKQHPTIVEWLNQQLDQPHRQHSIAAVGTGVCFLAETGWLDHQPATTHWHFFGRFEHQYPHVHLKRGVFITRSERLFCTASINALAELTALFIQEQYGERIAQEVERNFFHEIRQIRTQVSLNSPQATNDELVALATTSLDDSLNITAIKNSGQNFSIQQLAASLGVSTRSLNRHFQQALQVSPLQYLQRKRMQLGEELLKTSNLSIADIASHIGLQDPEHFSRQFKKTYGIAPKQYRQTVRGKVFN